jgi:hypothetical protein
VTGLLDLETEDLAAASRSVYRDAGDPLADAAMRLTTRLRAGGAMAGSDPSGRAWAASYDRAAAASVAATEDAVNACYKLSTMFARTAQNYAAADAASTPGGAGARPERLPPDSFVSIVFPLPSAAGGSGSTPMHWGLIDGLVGYVWPDGHQDRLRSAADAWRSCAEAMWAHSEYLAVAAVPALGHHLPESEDMSAVCAAMYEHVREVAHAQFAMASACDDLARHLDEMHSEVEHELWSLVAWTAAIETTGALVSVFTLGLAEAPTQAIEAARIARTAARVGELIQKFVALARAASESVAAVAERAATAASRLRLVLDARASEAGVMTARRLQAVRASGELGAAGRFSGEAKRAVTFADKASARTGLPAPMRPMSNRFFRGATAKSQDFKITQLVGGGHRMEFFTPAENAGYGKLYVQTIDVRGLVVSEYKDTLGPDGLIERKWVRGGPG